MKGPLIVSAVLLSLTACGGGYEPDMAKVQTDLAADIQKQEHTSEPVDVSCPSHVDWKPGSDFHCIVDGLSIITPARVTVSMENNDGEYTWVVDR